MRKLLFISVSLLFAICSCKNRPERLKDECSSEMVKSVFEKYVSNFLKKNKVITEEIGDISIYDGVRKYSFRMQDVVIGVINDNSVPDIIVPTKIYENNVLLNIEHLIFFDSSMNYTFAGKLENIYEVKGIVNKIIIVDYTEIAVDSPIYGCNECKEERRYKFVKNQFVRLSN